MKKVKVRRGLKIPLHGSVKNKEFDHIVPKFVGILADDYFSLKPKFLVKEGDSVAKGDPLFEDKTNPGFFVRSPVCGTVNSINRGEKRALVSVILENDKNASETPVTFRRSGNVSRDLNAAGLWDSFRERPFNRVPAIDAKPDHVFINACKTDVLELEPTDLIINNLDDFIRGIETIQKLTTNKIILCGSKYLPFGYFHKFDLSQRIIEGKFPSGNSSLHIQHIQPMKKSEKTWTIGWQDVLRIGKSMNTGKICHEKYVSVCGPACIEPKLVKTVPGANLEELSAGNSKDNSRRVSGSLLYGSHGDNYSDFLGRYSNQLSLVSDERKATFFNWLKFGFKDHSNSNVFFSSILKPKKFSFDTNINGGYRAIVPIGVFDEVNPFDIDPTLFLKSLAIADLVALRELGIFDLVAEDMAIFSYVCPSKYDYVALFNECMEMIWKEETS